MGAYETSYPARAQLALTTINQDRSYIHPSQDSVRIVVQVLNPHQQPIRLFARMFSLQGAIWDDTELFDDGLHGDGNPGDHIYGIVLAPVILEAAFRFSYRLVNLAFGDTLNFSESHRLTSIGPLQCEGYRIISQSASRIQLEVVLANRGHSASAPEVRAELVPRDSMVIRIINNDQSFGTIPAGGTAVNATPYIIDTIENPGILNFNVIIKSGGYPYWEYKDLVVGFESIDQDIPRHYSLYQNYPNPFNPITTIEFALPKTSNVSLKIFNILGEEVVTLVSNRLTAGIYTYEWDASNMASGVYLYHLETEGFIETMKMILMR
jgi:hypothetical protein